MIVTNETWVECRPILSSFFDTRARLQRLGEEIQEWHIHPIGIAVLNRQLSRSLGYWSGYRYGGAHVLGKPIVVDASVKPRRAKVLVKRTLTKVDA